MLGTSDGVPSHGDRNSPMMGQRFLGTVAVDEHAPSMLHRVAANWDDRQHHPRAPEERSVLTSGASHYGSMSSLNPPSPYSHHVCHQRSRAGRSLDEADPTLTSSNSYALLSAATSGRVSPAPRRPSALDKSLYAQNGRNSPRMCEPPSRPRQPGPASQIQRSHPTRMSGTSFSSSFH